MRFNKRRGAVSIAVMLVGGVAQPLFSSQGISENQEEIDPAHCTSSPPSGGSRDCWGITYPNHCSSVGVRCHFHESVTQGSDSFYSCESAPAEYWITEYENVHTWKCIHLEQ